MNTRILSKILIAFALTVMPIAQAAFDPVNDDTDIFLANPNIPANRPNVLVILDNTANWNQAFTNEKSALVQVINGLSDAYNVGLMMFPETGAPNDSIDGGYVRYHVRQMTPQNKTALASMVNNLDINTDKGNNATTGLALHEAYLYLSGKFSRSGHGKIKTDKDGTTDPLLSPLPGPHALPAGTSSGLYRSPLNDECQRTFIIYISNGPAAENATARAELEGYLATLTGITPPATIGITPSGQQGNWADEMAKFMANADVSATLDGVQNVYTYAVEVNPTITGQGPDMTALLKSMAANGKGKYFGVTSDASGTAIVDALNAIFTEVQAVNSVFASTTLPVSVNVRGTNLNQVYIGVFRPDPTKSPRWLGNLKMYNLALDNVTSKVYLADAANGIPPAVGNPAENATTGFITGSAKSFWTTPSAFWSFRDPSQNGVGGASDAPDGDLVEKGGAAQQIRLAFANAESASPARRLYTCTTGVVNGVSQDCQPNANFQLLKTPFNTLNDAIDTASLQLDTRLVSPLTAYQSKQINTLTDRLPVQYFTNTFFGTYIESLSNGANTATITNLTTATPKVLAGLTALVPNAQTVAIASVSKSSGNYRFQSASALPSNYVVGAIVNIQGTSNSLFNNQNYLITAVDTGNNRFVISGGPTGNESATGGTGTVTSGTTTSTTAQATLPAHGYVSGQSVTIAGANPTQFNGTFNITVIDNDHFNYTVSAAAGNASGTITASGNTTIATATTSLPHGFFAGTSVTIAGASNAAYNGTKTIIDCLPAASCTGATTFRYNVATAVGPNTNTVGVTASVGGTTTVVARIPNWWGYWCSATPPADPYSSPPLPDYCGHGFTTGQTAYISGSDISGYNGAFTVTNIDGRSFSFTTATVLPGNSSFNVYASTAVYDYIFGYAYNHNLKDGDRVVIESGSGADAITGTYYIYSVFESDYYFYIYAPGLPPITKTNYTIRPVGGTNQVTGLSGTPPQAYVTLWNHGYANGQTVRISNASPAGYNGDQTIRVCDGAEPAYLDRFGNTVTKQAWSCFSNWEMFTYPLATALGPNTSLAATASVKSTTARATSVNHGFANGSSVAISGASPGAFNGTYSVNVLDANTFTYTIATPEGDATGTITAGQTGASSTERNQIIRWVRGEDNFQDENSNASLADIRASVHGDVLHSRPAVINYNRYSSDNDVYVFYGGNDGIFHALKGGYAADASDPSGLQPGQEAWGFVASEFFGQFKRMRNNSPTISSSFKKPYFMDGPIGVYTKDSNVNGKLGDSGDAVNLYVAMRRGGRLLYALDVNNPNDPKYLWKISNASTGFSELGETWSNPVVVEGLGGLTFPVVVFGAGYDPAVEDIPPTNIVSANATSVTTPTGTVNRTMGRGIFVVNALTGALVWSAGAPGSGATLTVSDMTCAIPSDMTIVRNESGGPTRRAYVGDTCGNVWRIDFSGANLSTSTVTRLASVGSFASPASMRKFLHAPDVVGQSGFDAVLIGSGDREHPFDTIVVNRMYMFKDKGDDSGPVTGTGGSYPTLTESSLTDVTSNCLQDASGCPSGVTQADFANQLAAGEGWYLTLATGEKVIGNVISLAGTTFFNTNQPSASAGGGTCGSNLGVARQYQVSTADATAVADLNAVGGLTGADRSLIAAGGGYLPSPVHVVVMLGGKPVEAVISGIQVSQPPGATLSARLRRYWYREID